MRWRPTDNAVRQIAKAVSTLGPKREKSVIYGTAITREQTEAYVRDVLGMEPGRPFDEADDTGRAVKEAGDILEERLSSDAALPDWLENDLWDKDVDRTARDLCASMGLGLPRLLAVCAYASLDVHAQGTDEFGNDVLVRLKFRRNTGPSDRTAYDAEVRFNRQMEYLNGTITLREMAIPETMVLALKGQTVDRVVGHPWEGWKRIRVKSISQDGQRVLVRITSGMTALIEEEF
jgi:hypothetical protein